MRPEQDDKERALIDFLISKEPLSDDKCYFIVGYRCETAYVDFKESFNTYEQREWLNIIRDIVAFANTCGGYIVFGIKDKTFELVGIDEKDWKQLIDPDNIHKKVNAYIQPPLISLTSKKITSDGRSLVLVHIPESVGNTHIVVKEGKFKDNSGKEIIRLRKGEIYVRRSGSSQIIEPIDLDAIINRRINYFKDNLLNKISKIVEAPVEHEVLIIARGQEEINTEERKYVLSNAPDAIPVKGLSTTEIPLTDDSEIATSIALFRKNFKNLPGKSLLYRIYSNRTHLALSHESFGDLVLINIVQNIPCYYWLQYLSREEIVRILDATFERGSFFERAISLRIAGCLGKSHFMKYYKKYHDNRFDDIHRRFQQGIGELYFNYDMGGLNREQLEEEAAKLIEKLIKASMENKQVNVFDNDQLWTIDFKLYAENITRLRPSST